MTSKSNYDEFEIVTSILNKQSARLESRNNFKWGFSTILLKSIRQIWKNCKFKNSPVRINRKWLCRVMSSIVGLSNVLAYFSVSEGGAYEHLY